MHLGRFLRHVRQYFYRKHINWALKDGDLVVGDYWPTPIAIVDINWALQAAAVQLGPGAIVVWPLWGLRRYARSRPGR